MKPATALQICCALFLLLLAYNYSVELTPHGSAQYGEGPLLDQSMRFARGENIYRNDISQPPYTINMYGPLFYILQAPFLAFSAPTALYGNIISLLSHLLSALMAGLIVQHLTGNRTGRFITSIAVLASPLMGGGLPLYRVDLLAQAMSLTGMYFALTSQNHKGDAKAALFFAAAIFTKMTYAVAGPGSIFLFQLLRGNRVQGLRQALYIGVVSLVLLLLVQWLTAGGFVFNIITGNLLNYSLLQAYHFFIIAYIQCAIGLCVLPQIWQSKTLPANARLFAGIYAAFALLAALAAGRIGAHYGYFSEFQLSVALLLGIALPPHLEGKFKPYSLLLWAQMAAYAYFITASPYYPFVRTHRAALIELQEKVAAEPGLVLADDLLGVIPLAGKPLYFEACAITQLRLAGHWNQDAFVQDLRDGKFAMILMGESFLRKDRWSPEMLAAINERYALSEQTGLMDIWRRKP